MGIFKNESEKKEKADTNSTNVKSAPAEKPNYEGKKCQVCGTTEGLHVRKTRGGKLTVFNICNKHRGEKISTARKALKSKRLAQGQSSGSAAS